MVCMPYRAVPSAVAWRATSVQTPLGQRHAYSDYSVAVAPKHTHDTERGGDMTETRHGCHVHSRRAAIARVTAMETTFRVLYIVSVSGDAAATGGNLDQTADSTKYYM